MNKTVLKSNLHKLIDQIDNQNILEEFYNEIKIILERSQGNIWDKLNEDQKKDILLSYEESEIDNNLLDHDTVINKYKDWL